MHTRLFFSIIISGLLFMQCSGNQSAEKPIPTVNIGEQTWMDADLTTHVYLNGDSILEAKTEKAWIDACAKSQGCFRILNNGAHVYNGFAVTDARGLCPKGFKIPAMSDFKKLIDQFPLGGASQALATYNYYVEEWIGGDDGGLETIEVESNGKSGFKAMPAGFIDDLGVSNEGPCNFYWATSGDKSELMAESFGYCSNAIAGGMAFPQTFGMSIRAISEIYIPQDKQSAEHLTESSNMSQEGNAAPKAQFKSIKETDLSESGSESIHECQWGNLLFRSTTYFDARGHFSGINSEIISTTSGKAQPKKLTEVMAPSKLSDFLASFNSALKKTMEENKRKDPECYGNAEIRAYGFDEIEFDLTATGFVFSAVTGDAIWPCIEVVTYDHAMTYEQVAPYLIFE